MYSAARCPVTGHGSSPGIVRHQAEKMQYIPLLDATHDAVIATDRTGKIRFWNAAAERLFGYPAAEATGQDVAIIIPDEYVEAHHTGIRRVAEGGERNVIGNTVELTGKRRDGSIFPIELSLSAWEADGMHYFGGIIRDITERKRNEHALNKSREKLQRKTEKLKKANAKIHEKTNQLQGLSQKLAKYLSHQVFNSIFEGDRDVKIESYRKELTVFFSDIQGFTELSDRVEAEVLTQVLNSYLNEMSLIANKYGGTIDKFIGDAIMIFFGDPETRGAKDDALACVSMALEMRGRLSHLQQQWRRLGIDRPLQVRMGINTGYCTVGNFGSEERMDYTIVGSEVNLAHRLESHAETNQILIAESTYLLVREEIACTSKQEIRIKGFHEPIATYQVIGPHGETVEKDTLHTTLEGFVIELNTAALDTHTRSHVRDILQRALSMVAT